MFKGVKILTDGDGLKTILVEFYNQTDKKGRQKFHVLNGAWDGWIEKMGDEHAFTVEQTGDLFYPIYVHDAPKGNNYNDILYEWEQSRKEKKDGKSGLDV